MGAARKGYGVSGRAAQYDRRKPGQRYPPAPRETEEEKAERARYNGIIETQHPVPYHWTRIAEALGFPVEHAEGDVDRTYFMLPHHWSIVDTFVKMHAALPVRGQVTIARRLRKRIDPILAAQALGAPADAIERMIREARR